MNSEFHLAIAVNSIDDEVGFFVGLLGARVTHREPAYTNLYVLGAQITLKEIPGIQPSLPEFHFGFNMTLNEFDKRANSILSSQANSFRVLLKPTVVEANTPMERKKMYLKSPTGYHVELKGYKVLETLIALEQKLHEPSVRRDAGQLDLLLDETFFEFGASGNVWTREAIVQSLQGETSSKITATDFQATQLSPNVYLVTYKSQRLNDDHSVSEALRSSIWRMRDGQWKMVFHQGTRL